MIWKTNGATNAELDQYQPKLVMCRRNGSRFCTGTIKLSDQRARDMSRREAARCAHALERTHRAATSVELRSCRDAISRSALAFSKCLNRKNSTAACRSLNSASRSSIRGHPDRWNFNQIRNDFLRRRNGSPVLSGNDCSWTGKRRCAGVEGETAPKSSADGRVAIAARAAA